MLVLPIVTPGNQNDLLIVVLDDTQIERMAKADPAQVVTKVMIGNKKLVNPSIMICHESDAKTAELIEITQTGDLEKIINHLQRGWEFRPDLGDHDNPPEKIATVKGKSDG